MKVVVFQCPCGTAAIQRSPLGARPRARVMFVLVPVSSKKTNVVMSSAGCASVHACRAACTSSRSCSLACRVFFIGELPVVELMPQGGWLNRHALVRQPLAELRQREIRLGLDPRPKLRFQSRHAGPPIPADRPALAFAVHPMPAFHLIDPAH